MTMHRKMAETLDTVIEEIKEIQREAREEGKTERPFWPMIVLRTPKGWTGPKVVDGKEITIRKPKKADTYSEEAGLAMAIVKKWAGNNGNYNNIFRKFIPEMAKEEKAAKKAKKAQKAEK